MNQLQVASQTLANTSWKQYKNYQQEQRDMKQVKGLVLRGGVEVVFVRSNTPTLIIAGETQKAIDSVKTTFKGGKLIIEQQGGSNNTVITGNNSFINISCGGSVTVNGKTISGNGESHGKVVVAIALPEIQQIGIEGSSDVQLNDLQQAVLSLNISGSGDIEANGSVNNLTATIAGSGDIDAEDLIAQHVTLSIAGSGDAELHAKQSASVTIAGSGDAKIYGRPASMTEQVFGSGKVKCK